MNLMLWPSDGLASHPGGSRNTHGRFMLEDPEIGAGLMEMWATCFVCKLHIIYLNKVLSRIESSQTDWPVVVDERRLYFRSPNGS